MAIEIGKLRLSWREIVWKSEGYVYLRLMPDGIEWEDGQQYIYWWNWLSKDHRYLGYEAIWYDGPHASFGFWYTNVTWRLYMVPTRIREFAKFLLTRIGFSGR